MFRPGIRSALVLVCFWWPTVSAAQNAPAYVGGGLRLSPWSSQPSWGGGASTSYTNSTTDRLIAGIDGEAGWFFRPATAVGVEISMPVHRAELSQRYGYVLGSAYERLSRYREIALVGVVRHNVTVRRRVRVAIVGGGGLVQADAIERYATRQSNSISPFGPLGDESHVTHRHLGLTGGVDVSAPVTTRLSFVPQFRVLVVSRGNRTVGGGRTSFATLGLPTIVYSAGIGVRVGF
jgi:hypothetical protein